LGGHDNLVVTQNGFPDLAVFDGLEDLRVIFMDLVVGGLEVIKQAQHDDQNHGPNQKGSRKVVQI
jgi:hypothetical protein